MDRRSRMLAFALVAAIAANGVLAWDKYASRRDFTLHAVVSCDPSAESCFVHSCDPETEECDGAEDSYYKLVFEDADRAPACPDGECPELSCPGAGGTCAEVICTDASRGEYGIEDECDTEF